MQVAPIGAKLPSIGQQFKDVPLPGDSTRKFRSQFWYDPNGSSKVAITSMGVVVLEDVGTFAEHGLANTVYTSGFLKGIIEADFIKPLPARGHFLEDSAWAEFISTLQSIAPQLEKDMESARSSVDLVRQGRLLRMAQRIVQELLREEDFQELQLIEGLTRVSANHQPSSSNGKRSNGASRGRGSNGHDKRRSQRSNTRPVFIRDAPFYDAPHHHSRLKDGAIEINTTNPDFLALSSVPTSQQVAYLTFLLGKEIIALNDATGLSDEPLERMLTYGLRAVRKIWA